jgi:hypothetical protein
MTRAAAIKVDQSMIITLSASCLMPVAPGQRLGQTGG